MSFFSSSDSSHWHYSSTSPTCTTTNSYSLHPIPFFGFSLSPSISLNSLMLCSLVLMLHTQQTVLLVSFLSPLHKFSASNIHLFATPQHHIPYTCLKRFKRRNLLTVCKCYDISQHFLFFSLLSERSPPLLIRSSK